MQEVDYSEAVIEAIGLYEEYQLSQRWAKAASKINTCLPKAKAKKWDEIEKEANDRLEYIEKKLAETVDNLNEEDLEEFRGYYGI